MILHATDHQCALAAKHIQRKYGKKTSLLTFTQKFQVPNQKKALLGVGVPVHNPYIQLKKVRIPPILGHLKCLVKHLLASEVGVYDLKSKTSGFHLNI